MLYVKFITVFILDKEKPREKCIFNRYNGLKLVCITNFVLESDAGNFESSSGTN